MQVAVTVVALCALPLAVAGLLVVRIERDLRSIGMPLRFLALVQEMSSPLPPRLAWPCGLPARAPPFDPRPGPTQLGVHARE